MNPDFRTVAPSLCSLLAALVAGCGSPGGGVKAETDSALVGDESAMGHTGPKDAGSHLGAKDAGAKGEEAGGSTSGRWPNSGDFAEWYSGPIPDLSYIVGGQVVLEWSDLDTISGYKWKKLGDALSAMTVPTTLQINATTKPTYIYDTVPYADMSPCSSWPTDPEVGDKDPANGCLRVPMYWHPAFQTIYTQFLAALGQYLHSTSAGAKVV